MSGSLRETRLYYDDAYATTFEAEVVAEAAYEGRRALILDRTCFYPESGGQLADRGTLGAAAVVDVQVGDDDRVLHVLDEGADGPGVGPVSGVIDRERRFDFMQQHTGQHVLSAAFERVLGAVTLSSRLGEAAITIESDLDAADWRMVERAEQAANRLLWEDRLVERHWVDAEGAKRFALRKPPAVEREIRIVEIPDWDVSACGGTHVRRTGEVGIIKVLGWERVRGHVRFEFVCGERAYRDHAWRTEALVEAARRQTLKDRDLLEHLERALAERDQLRREAAELRKAQIAREARERVGEPPGPVADFAASRDRGEVRLFVIQCLEAGAPWAAAAAAGPDPVVVVGRAKALDLDLKALLPELLERCRGKGGGSPTLLQVTAADGVAAEAAHAWMVGRLREVFGGAA
jgi:alanyl-tRNA synthetase